MCKRIFVLALLSFYSGDLTAIAGEPVPVKQPAPGSTSIERIVIRVPPSVDENLRDSIIDRLTGMENHPFIYLDLSIVFSGGSKEAIPFTQIVNGKPLKNGSADCAFGPLLMGRGVRYELGAVAGYTHLLMSVITGERSTFPFNDVSCEYRGSGDLTAFRVRGFFHVLSNAIPTASMLQLRPVHPPFGLAARVLAGK